MIQALNIEVKYDFFVLFLISKYLIVVFQSDK